MQDSDSRDTLAEFFGLFGSALEHREARRIWTQLEAALVPRALTFLKRAGFTHLSTITVLDTGREFEVIYHLCRAGHVFSLRTCVGRDKPRLASIVGIYPGAVLYEREACDLFGLEFEGHPDPRALVLPEGWPAGEHPLRKDWRPPNGGAQDA